MQNKKASQEDDYSQWYNNTVLKAGLADYSPVRGCMIIKPYGFALWENMRDVLDRMFKKTGHQNAYFPLFIPKSFLSKEAAHVDGFAKECAVVTHYRLKNDPNGNGIIVDPDAKLDEELIIRPTSETIIWNTYRDWIKSYRDLPLLINQWANVVRWEMRTRLFLRTTEFLWQEGHTAHSSAEEAIEETKKILELYADFAENYMAIPVVKGIKSSNERFAGADETYCIEMLMGDGKALQAGTSHFLGQNFAKAFEVQYLDKNNQQQWVWATSWGVSTRLIGGLVMAHGDEKGLQMPPKIAPIQVVLIPIYKKEDSVAPLKTYLQHIAEQLISKGIRVKIDDNENNRPGWKFSEYELQGIPIRLVAGLKEMEQTQIEVARRDKNEKQTLPILDLAETLSALLEDIQNNMFQRALSYRDTHTTEVDDMNSFQKILEEKGGFISAHWDGTSETELKIKELTKATLRCIPLNAKQEQGKCVLTGNPSQQRVLFALAY